MDTSAVSSALGANLTNTSQTAAAGSALNNALGSALGSSSATTGTGTGSSQSVAGAQQVSQTFDTFLKLLTAQLQNQDPLQPMDSTTFTQQLVSYSQVEQQINTNSNLQTLINNMQANEFSTAVGYIGKTVEATGDKATIQSGSGADWSYTLPSNAQSVTLNVADQNGRVVFSTSGQTGAGTSDFAWNGQDGSGNAQPAGTYTLSVNALDASGKAITAATSISGQVQGVETVNNVLNLMINGQAVPVSSVTKVTNTASN